MLPLEPKPPDPCPCLFSFLFWSSPCPDSSLNPMHSVTRVQGVNLPYFVVDCSSLGNVSSFVRPEWSFRALRLPPLQPSLAFFDSTPDLGFTGVVIVASAVGFTFVNPPIFWFGSLIRHRFLIPLCVAQSFGRISVLVNLVAYGFLVDVLYKLAGGSFLYTTPNLLLWHLLSVSLHLRFMGFRSEFQVRFLILFPSPFRVRCCHSLHLRFIALFVFFEVLIIIPLVFCVFIMLGTPSRWLSYIILLWRPSPVCSNCLPLFFARCSFCRRCPTWVRTLFWPVRTAEMHLCSSMSTQIPGQESNFCLVDVGSCSRRVNFSCVCSGLVSDEQCGSSSPLFPQDLFVDDLWARICSALPRFWLDATGLRLWPSTLCVSRPVLCLFYLYSRLWYVAYNIASLPVLRVLSLPLTVFIIILPRGYVVNFLGLAVFLCLLLWSLSWPSLSKVCFCTVCSAFLWEGFGVLILVCSLSLAFTVSCLAGGVYMVVFGVVLSWCKQPLSSDNGFGSPRLFWSNLTLSRSETLVLTFSLKKGTTGLGCFMATCCPPSPLSVLTNMIWPHGFDVIVQYQLSILCLWRSWLHILHLGGMFSDKSMFLLWQVKNIWEVYLFVFPRPVSRLPFGLPLVYLISVFAPWCVHFHGNWFCNVHPQYGTAPYGHTWFTGLWFGDIVIVVIHLSWIHDQGLRNDAWIIMALKFHAPEIQDSLVLCALCQILGLLWAYFSYGTSVSWLIARDSYFAHLYILFHQCNSCHHFMYLLDLLICLLRGNVEIPIRNFPRPSLLWHQNNPFWGQHGFCMSIARVVFLMFSYKPKYPVEGVFSVLVF